MDIKAFIAALGGPAKVARELGITTAAVSNWPLTGRVPAEHHIALWTMATAAGLDWTPPGAEGMALVPKAEAAA